jgi:predicted ATPase/class 3 adenylate cyclase/tetratricopeptide (TPR) repeat protein
MADCPTGTITFLFTDVEGSTHLWEQHPETVNLDLARHEILLSQAIESHDGCVFKTVGDGVYAAFATARTALSAAIAAQCALYTEPWHTPEPIRVRMALHTGTAEQRGGDYFGPSLNRVARLLATGHGGQILLTKATYVLVRNNLPEGVALWDLGEHRLPDLAQSERVFQVVHPELPEKFPPLRSLDHRRNNLPLQLTSFVGRERELDEIRRQLEQARLLTLTGPGGVGKPRLALQVAADLLDRFADGVWLVDLAPLSDPGLVAEVVASSVGVREETNRPVLATLASELQDRMLLVLLDNCEHLLDASAELVVTLLRACPSLRVLATSREPLRLSGEFTYPVPTLALPDLRNLPPVESLTQYEAVELFVERAALTRAGFAVTSGNASAVAHLCHRLDGIPLAVELAAAWVRVLSPEEIASRLDNRFRFLTGGARTALRRQQTLQAMIDWSHDLLSDSERVLLRRLSVFAGGWTLEAAETVCGIDTGTVPLPSPIHPQGGYPPSTREAETRHTPIHSTDILDLLSRLVDKSLVVVEQTPGGDSRFRLLETIRHYGHERLLEAGEAERVRQSHAEFFLGLAEEAEPHLAGAEQGVWLDGLEREHDNFRAALEWSLSQGSGGHGSGVGGQEGAGTFRFQPSALSPQPSALNPREAGLRLVGALWRFWEMRGHLHEGRHRLEQVLARGAERTTARAKALEGAGALAWGQSDYSAAQSLLEESLAIRRELGDQAGIAGALNWLGLVRRSRHDYEAARRLHQESRAICQQSGDTAGVAAALVHLGRVAHEQDDLRTARAFYEASLAMERQSGNSRGVALSLNRLGLVAYVQGDYPMARSLFEESLAIRRELGDRAGIAGSLSNLGLAVQEMGDYEGARTLFEESLAIERELGDRRGTVILLNNLGDALRCLEDDAAARSALEEAMTLAREHGYRADLAEALRNLALVVNRQGDPAAARTLLRESLSIERELWNRWGIAAGLEALAGAFSAGEPAPHSEAEQAAQLLGAAQALREATAIPVRPSTRADWERSRAAARTVLGVEAYQAAWAAGRAMPLEEALQAALESGGGPEMT